MRKIRLSDTDAALFDEEMLPADYEFLARHKDTFCRMWMEQGRTFWRRYLEVFRSYIVRYSLLGDLPCDTVHLEHALEHAFKLIEKNFVEGKANQAKSFLYQIADLGRNRHKFGYLDSKSVSKDPFYTKDTRDLFRDFFGQAKEKSSYIRVYLLTPVYMRFGGSVVRSLIIWKEAEEIDPSDDSYYIPPLPIEYHKPSPAEEDCTSVLCPVHLEDCNTKFYQVALSTPHAPLTFDFWTRGDPRFEVPENPLYDPHACRKTDWREGLSIQRFSEWYVWCSFSDITTKPENQCPDCRARKKAKKRRQKKKKKGPSTLAEFGYDDESIMADSGVSWDGLGGGSGVKALSSIDDGHGHHKDCPYANLDPSSKFALFDNSIAVDVSDRIKKKSHLNQVSSCPSASQDSNNSSSSSVDPPSKASTNAELSGQPGKGGNQTAGPQNGLSAVKLKEANSSLSMAERAKLLEARKISFTPDSEMCRLEDVAIPDNSKGESSAYFEVNRSWSVRTGASELQVILKRVNLSDKAGSEKDSAKSTELGKKMYPELTSEYLSKAVEGVPPGWLCAERSSWCGVEVDYSFKEKDPSKKTHFILQVYCNRDSPDLNLARGYLLELLRYVARRKKRQSPSWVMSEEDVFSVCQTLKRGVKQLVGMSVVISTRVNDSPVIIYTQPNVAKQMALDRKEASFAKSQARGCDDLVKTVAEGKGAMGLMPDSFPKTNGTKLTQKDKSGKTDQGITKNCVTESTSDKPVAVNVKPKQANGAISKAASVSDTRPNTASATAKKHSENQAPTAVSNQAASGACLDDGGDREGDKGKKKKKKGKSTVAVTPAPTNPPPSFPLSRTPEDNLALANAKTQEELAQILARMAGEGKVNHLSQSCISSPGPRPPGSAGAPRQLTLTGSGDASQAKTGERQKSRCAYCGVIEPALRTYKKCLRCKEENVPNARYYCGRPCQMKDWKLRHNIEHQQQLYL